MRDVVILLGHRLDAPARVLLCWTRGGADDAVGVDLLPPSAEHRAIRLASQYGIRVMNLSRTDHQREIERIFERADRQMREIRGRPEAGGTSCSGRR